MTWSPGQYSKFERERNRPIQDLLAQLPAGQVARAVDIGCGPGNSTELLQARFPEAAVMGIDSSADMLAAATLRLPAVPFRLADIATWDDPGPFDVILANAALQWVPDHATLLPALLSKLAPGGYLAVQIPDNLEEPAHRLMREVAAQGPWAAALSKAPRAMDNRHSPAWYHQVLRGHAVDVDVWRTTYFHQLAGGPAAIVEWFKSTALRPFLAPLRAEAGQAFLAQYEAALAQAYPSATDGTVLLPFPRLFFIARRAARATETNRGE